MYWRFERSFQAAVSRVKLGWQMDRLGIDRPRRRSSRREVTRYSWSGAAAAGCVGLFGLVQAAYAETPAVDDPGISAISPVNPTTDRGGQPSSLSNSTGLTTTGAAANALGLVPGNFSVSAGASAWSGDFGSTSTTTISVQSLSGSFRKDDLRLSVTLPYSRIDTRGNIFLGLGATPLIVRPDTTSAKRVNDGLGDLTFNGSYVLHLLPNAGLDLELLGAVKAPTASASSRLSTGKADYSFGAEVLQSYGRIAPFASLVYREFGSSQQYRLRDGAATSIGLSYVLAKRWIADVSYDYARSASRFVGDAHELVSSTSYNFDHPAIRVSAYVSAGLSSGAPAVSGGVSLRKTL